MASSGIKMQKPKPIYRTTPLVDPETGAQASSWETTVEIAKMIMEGSITEEQLKKVRVKNKTRKTLASIASCIEQGYDLDDIKADFDDKMECDW